MCVYIYTYICVYIYISIFPALIWEELLQFMEGNAYTLVALIGAGLCEVQHSNQPTLPISIPWVLPDRTGQCGNGEVRGHIPGFFPQELWKETWPRCFLMFFPSLESKSLSIQTMRQEKSHLHSHLLLSPLSPSIWSSECRSKELDQRASLTEFDTYLCPWQAVRYSILNFTFFIFKKKEGG